MQPTHTDRRRSLRRAVWSRATILWEEDEQCYSVRGHIRDLSPHGCSLVTLSRIPARMGAISALEFDLASRCRVAHTRRRGPLHVTGLEFLASLPRD